MCQKYIFKFWKKRKKKKTFFSIPYLLISHHIFSGVIEKGQNMNTELSADDYLRMAERLSSRASMVQNSPAPTYVRRRRIDDNLGTPSSSTTASTNFSISRASIDTKESTTTPFHSRRTAKARRIAPRRAAPRSPPLLSFSSPSPLPSPPPPGDDDNLHLQWEKQLIKLEESMRLARAECVERENVLMSELELVKNDSEKLQRDADRIFSEKKVEEKRRQRSGVRKQCLLNVVSTSM